jgi:hypothetical protein
LGGDGTVRGYRTLNVLGVGTGRRRGILYHHLFSSAADDFVSESREMQEALTTVGTALAAQKGRITYVMDKQFDDIAVWATIWDQGNHLVCRLQHPDRHVEAVPSAAPAATASPVSLTEVRQQLRELARVRTELLIRKIGQRFTKRQPTTAIIRACPLQVPYQPGLRTTQPGPRHTQPVWLVEVRLDNVAQDPWLLLTDWPVTDETSALRIFRMYRERWAIEDCFKFTKTVLGWEDVQLLDLRAIRTLVALGWVAAGFLYELGVTLDWPEIRLLARLGGGELRPQRPPGKTVLTRGLQRLLDHWATDAILADEIRRHGALPPRIAAFLGPNWQPPS